MLVRGGGNPLKLPRLKRKGPLIENKNYLQHKEGRVVDYFGNSKMKFKKIIYEIKRNISSKFSLQFKAKTYYSLIY